MHEFDTDFVREGLGAWRCIRPTELQLRFGRIQVAEGTRFTSGGLFMGLDFAQILEAHAAGACERCGLGLYCPYSRR